MGNDNLIIDTFSELAPRYERVVDLELNRFWGSRYGDFVDQLINLTSIKSDDAILDIATGTILNTPVQITLLGSDPDNGPQTIVFSTTSSPQEGVMTWSGNDIIFTPNTSFVGVDLITFRARPPRS